MPTSLKQLGDRDGDDHDLARTAQVPGAANTVTFVHHGVDSVDGGSPTPSQGLRVVRDSDIHRAAEATSSGILRHLGVTELSEQAAEDFRKILSELRQIKRLDSCLAFPSVEAMTHRVDVEVDPEAAKILLAVRFSIGARRVQARGELHLIGGNASSMDWSCEDDDVDLSSLDAIKVDWILSKVREKLFPSR